jgi:hypothetical protein
MPTNRKTLHRAHRGRLSHVADCVLRYGREDRWADAFESEEEHRAAWERVRDNFLSQYRHGHRPAAWWGFDSPIPYPAGGYDRERSTLYEAGLLDEEERAWLLADWRREFARAQSADFFFCDGPQSFFHGATARRKHYRWADIPDTLVREWTAEHQRRRKTIRKLEQATESVEARPAESST